MTEIVQPTPEGIARAAELLRRGQVVAMPTETVYGLAAHALDAEAVARVFEAKARPSFDPLIVHVADFARQGLDAESGVVDATRLDTGAREVVDRLAQAFWPGPLTLVLPRARRVPDLVTSGLDTVGVRVPAHPVAQALLRAVGLPLAAPSANRFGRISPTRAEHVMAELSGRIPMVLDGGPTPVGIESTVVGVGEGGALVLLRPGGVTREALEAVAGRPLARAGGDTAHPENPLSPGLLESHYAPTRRVHLLPAPVAELDGPALARAVAGVEAPVALLLQVGDEAAQARAHARVGEALGGAGCAASQVLSRAGDPAEAARGLFAALRALDETPGVQAIVAEPVARDTGLLHAIQDRLRRAAAPRPAGEGPAPE
jgi:L-threonylcarbamoyladenylate synthase